MKQLIRKLNYLVNGRQGLGMFILDEIRNPLKEIVKYEAEHGDMFTLPMEFKSDPAAWLLILQKIEAAVEHEWLLSNDWDGHEEIEEHHQVVKEGFELLGKYLKNLKKHD